MANKFDETSLPDLGGKQVFISGANSGLGFETTRMLSGAGATVYMGCRNEEKALAAIKQIQKEHPEADLHFHPLDLADLSTVAACADKLSSELPHLDVLLNNAGVMALPRRETVDGFEMQIGINHFGHFALTLRLLPLLKKAPGARVVSVASQAHRFGRMNFKDIHHAKRYSAWSVYGQSKLANLLFIHGLAKRLETTSIKAVAAHPGYSATNLQMVGPQMNGSGLSEKIMSWSNSLFAMTAKQGALPQVAACVKEDIENGDYLGPHGLFEMWGSPKKVGRSRAAQNPTDAETLWEMSEVLTDLTFPIENG